MSFNLRDFIKKGLLDAVGKMADYQVVLNAAGWHEKDVLTVEDLEEINASIEARKPLEISDENDVAGLTED